MTHTEEGTSSHLVRASVHSTLFSLLKHNWQTYKLHAAPSAHIRGTLIKLSWLLVVCNDVPLIHLVLGQMYLTLIFFSNLKIFDINVYFSFSGSAWDHQKPDEHWMCCPRLASWHHPRLWRPRQCALFQDAESNLHAGLQWHFPVSWPLAIMFPWSHDKGHGGEPWAASASFQVKIKDKII